MISLNAERSSMFGDPAVLYFMNLLPYIKYATDPLIYGKRLLGLKEELERRMKKLCCRSKLRRPSTTVRTDPTRRVQLQEMVGLV